MATYRLFCLDEGGHISTLHDFDDDSAAMACARTTYPDNTCKLWELVGSPSFPSSENVS